MDASHPGTDPLARYGAGPRLKIRAQARRLAEILAAFVPPAERGAWSGQQWEEAYYEAILEQCAPGCGSRRDAGGRVVMGPQGVPDEKE